MRLSPCPFHCHDPILKYNTNTLYRVGVVNIAMRELKLAPLHDTSNITVSDTKSR